MELIIYLLLFNFLLYLVPFFTNFREQPNPLSFLQKNNTRRELIRNLDWKISSDPFRILYEYSLLILLFSTLNTNEIWVIILCTFVGSFSFLYLIYISVMQYVFKKSPSITSDIILAKSGLLILRKYKYLIYLGLLILLISTTILFYFTTTFFLNLPNLHWLVTLILLCLMTFLAFRILSYLGYKFLVAKNVFIVSFHFYKNIRLSLKYRKLIKKDKDYFENYNIYDSVKFNSSIPNLKLISFESYGSILFQNESYREEIIRFYNENLKDRLEEHNLKIASSFSLSPAFGGGSWLCYSSFFYGIKFEEQDLYEILFSNTNNFSAYKGIFDILKENGFKTYHTSGLHYTSKDPIDWGKIKRNIRHDEMFDILDLNFKGQFMKFLKGRKCLPDQYTLNKTQEKITHDQVDKHALFFANLNSHVPYDSPLKAVKNWKNLDKLEYKTNSSESNLSRKYIQSILYQLDYLFDYISNESDNSLFILFGDHQPPFIAKESDGKETPIHIIYKDEDFIKPFINQGFTSGFIPQNKDKSSIKHEGLLSLLMQGLNKAYGENKELDLPYLPNGNKIV